MFANNGPHGAWPTGCILKPVAYPGLHFRGYKF